jgi:uncharacterized protein (TIGR02588 family)
MAKDSEKTEHKNVQDKKTPALEWMIAALGLILVVGTIGFLIYQAFKDKSAPPDLSVQIDSIIKMESGYLVNFSVYNKGDDNAADVVVEGKIKQNGEDLETSSVTIDYAPSDSKREGGLFFTKNPGEGNFEIRALGYTKP